ncbi:hypothetical protein D3C81_1399360 [compost metagenome]
MRPGGNAHRDHVLGLGAGIEVDATQEQQKLGVGQGQQPWPGVFFKQQVAGEFAQAAGLAQPGLGLRMTAVQVQPQALGRLQLQAIELGSSNRTRTALSIEHQGMYKPPLRIIFLEHPYSTNKSRPNALLRHLQRAWRHQHTIVVGVNVLTRTEGHAGERHGHVEVADATLVGLHRMTGQGLHAQVGLGDDIDITNATVDHQAFPAVLRGLFREHVAQQRAAQGTAAIDHQHLALAIEFNLFLDQ